MKRIIVLFMFALVCVSTLFVSTKTCYAETTFPNFNNKAYILVDKTNGEVLLEKNSHQKMQVASICKLMTTLITLENIEDGKLSLEDKVVASEYACSMEGSQAFLDAGSEYKVGDLLKSVIVASANDSAVVLAEHIAGSESEFTKLMNSRAKDLGMNETVYANSTGLPSPKQYSTAYDTTLVLRKLNNFETYKNDCKIWMDDFVHPSGRVTQLVNTNRLVKYYAPCVSGKTGFTDEAGYCLSACASKNNMDLVAVVLGCRDSSSRFSECMDILNYGFAHYEIAKIIDVNDEILDKVSVLKGKENYLPIKYANDFYLLKERGNDSQIKTNISLNTTVKAPISSGDIVGEVTISKNGVVVGKVNIVASEDVDKQTYKDVLEKLNDNWNLIA